MTGPQWIRPSVDEYERLQERLSVALKSLATAEAKLVEAIAQAREEGRQEEREACAWTCERQRDCETDLGSTDCASRFATAIRARGEAR